MYTINYVYTYIRIYYMYIKRGTASPDKLRYIRARNSNVN